MITLHSLQADPAAPTDGASVLAYTRDGAGAAITSTSGALDVSIANASLVVTASNLDIRDLAFATDKVDASGSAVSITGTVAVTQSTSPWTVDGTVELGATTLAALETITVVATDLDIRNLSHSQDSIKIGDGTDFLAINADGSINTTVTISGQYAEDSAHVSGDIGLFNLSVRADAPAIATSAAGDYAAQTVDAYNRHWSNTGSNISMSTGASTVTTTSALLVAASAGRRKIIVQNNGDKRIEVGASGVTYGTGLVIPSGVSAELEIGPALALHAVAQSGSQNVRYMQVA